MALSNLTKVQTVGIGSNIEVVGVITTGQFKSGTSNLHSTGVELTNLNVSGIATIGGNLSIGGTLTYQDVTNIDSVGLITARNGINVSGGNITINNASSGGVIINTGHPLLRLNDTDSSPSLIVNIESVSGDLFLDTATVHRDVIISSVGRTNEIARFTGDGKVGINTSIPSTAQDLTIDGASNYEAGIFFKQAGVNQYRFMTEGGTGNVYYDVYGIGGAANGDHIFRTKTSTGATEALRITEDGNIGINVTPANYSNYVTLALNDSTGSTIEGRVGGTLTGSFSVDSLVSINAVTSIPIVFKTTNTERLRITSNGNMQHSSASGVSYFTGSSEYIFGSTTSSPPAGGFESPVQIHTSKTRSAFTLAGYNNNNGGPFMTFLSSRSTTRGTLGSKVQSNDYIGSLRFTGDNATNYNSVAHGATIWARAKSTPGDGDSVIAGELHFATGTANAGSVTDNMVIQKDGQLDLKRGRVNDAGHMVYRGGGRIAGTATVSFDIPVLSDGNIYWIEAFYTHHSLSYGGYLYGVYGAYSGHSGLQINNTIGSSTAGGTNVGTWSVSRGSAGQPVVIAKSAGSYGGYGHWWIHVHAGTTPNL